MSSVLYISYTGLTEPLGESQVLQYLVRLAREHRITLLSFERAAKRDRIPALAVECEAAGIVWHRPTYHNRPGVPATAYDIAAGTARAVALARASRAEIVHARSYIPGLMALGVKRATGARFVFDMRGFWPDERADAGIWKRQSRRYRFFKGVERRLLLAADRVVSLTHAGAREIAAFHYLAGRVPPISVIPTCTNLDLFSSDRAAPQAGFTLGYVGSVGSWYLFDEIARAVRLLFEMDRQARFLIVNQRDHDFIARKLGGQGVDLSRVEIAAANYRDVARHIARMSAGIFFIRPLFSKRASCPTKMGEFLACGRPCLGNSGVGDVAEDLAETGTGIAVSAFDEATLRQALRDLIALAQEPGMAGRCRRVAEERFSLERGVRAYSEIYRSLADRTRAAA